MALTLIPDAEQLLTSFLRDQAEVAALVEDRVYTTLPKTGVSWPAVRVVRWGGIPPVNQPLWLDGPQFQIDVWGGPKKLASEIAETIRAVCAERIVGSHPTGVVTSCNVGSSTPDPDESFDPPRPRFRVAVTLTIHPTGS